MKDLIGPTIIAAIFLLFVVACPPTQAGAEAGFVSTSRDQRDILSIMEQAYVIGEQQAKIAELEKRNQDLVDAMVRIANEVSQALDPQ